MADKCRQREVVTEARLSFGRAKQNASTHFLDRYERHSSVVLALKGDLLFGLAAWSLARIPLFFERCINSMEFLRYAGKDNALSCELDAMVDYPEIFGRLVDGKLHLWA